MSLLVGSCAITLVVTTTTRTNTSSAGTATLRGRAMGSQGGEAEGQVLWPRTKVWH